MTTARDSAHLSALGRRAQRLVQLQRLSDEEFAAELRQQQSSRWAEGDLVAHARKHRGDWVYLLGRPISPSEVTNYSDTVLTAWDRLFTGLEPDGRVTYAFVGSWPGQGGIIVVATREGRIRTAIPMSDEKLGFWLERHTELVEVSGRAKSLGL